MIVCVLIRQFAIAVERRERPELASQPLVLTRLQGQGNRRQERVYAASAAGVQPGMKLSEAQALCPEAHYLPAAISRCHDALAQVVEALTVFTDRLEVEDDFGRYVTFYLDMGRLNGADTVKLGRQIGASCLQLHLPVTVGVAEGKFTACAAAQCSRALRVIPPGAEAKFLAPLPVSLLPLEGDMERQLWLLGIERLGQFAALPKGAVLAQFGKRGRLLHELASGRDGRLLYRYTPPVRERVQRRFSSPVEDRQLLEHALGEMAGELAKRLEAGAVDAQEVMLLVQMENGVLGEQLLRLRQPVSGAASLCRVLARALERMTITGPVVGIEVQLERLVAQLPQQLSLFAYAERQQRQLDQVVQQLTRRFGEDGYFRALPAERSAPLPQRRYRLERIEP